MCHQTNELVRTERGCGTCYSEDVSTFSARIGDSCSGSELLRMVRSDPARVVGLGLLAILFATGMYRLYTNLARRHARAGYDKLPTNVQVFETETCAVL